MAGNLTNSFIANFLQIATLEEFENRPVFDEVMHKILLVRFFRTRCSYGFSNSY